MLLEAGHNFLRVKLSSNSGDEIEKKKFPTIRYIVACYSNKVNTIAICHYLYIRTKPYNSVINFVEWSKPPY